MLPLAHRRARQANPGSGAARGQLEEGPQEAGGAGRFFRGLAGGALADDALAGVDLGV